MFQTFAEASEFISINKHMAIKDDEKLMLYALYKMSTVGKPPVKEFGMFEMKEKMKYNAWVEFSSNYKCEHAEELYITFANKLYEKYLSPNK
jgi:diazepam-binding inhibitor (GABA receptor modulating acyl-CoA-binding protein)